MRTERKIGKTARKSRVFSPIELLINLKFRASKLN